ncbi:MAG: hypothetical protein NVSMB52_03690 [Chloroflexota bacterium]
MTRPAQDGTISIFPLDSVRNATIDREVELLLEDVREEVRSFTFPRDFVGTTADIIEVYDLARPRLNLITSVILGRSLREGVDVSTGLGFLPVLLARSNINAIATERDLSISLFAQAQGIDVRRYQIGQSDKIIESASLDFVVLAEVLEHLKMPPRAVVEELGRFLRVGGTFILTTPNIARLQHLEALAAGENFLEPFPDETPIGIDPTDLIEHVREYSIREVVDAVEGAGLGVDQVLMTGWGQSGYDLLPNPYANEICVVIASV